ncbi:hypothetical protein GGE16_001492 [Rhizobium leguminosarum]|uniref:Uncharacterized protein n=1 Tax=Rhizobium leguminosarum TaxID=384 RepID=A0AAE2MHJ9_RHILE|nr:MULTISPECIES: hypothetical protein [Rhizobium]MBB4289476.1 hypothetical protein [Rhizobium leguminosarum]MBB4294429.1 hypothetical protein [Rhizobium leguminosarum]MBB4305824.1 hypothetical protein [Rhizobium leguminosarum]MBB4418598.1 hypothetical protein [Rhizobium leguminosarum]MBB4433443.1 hypothetical protein [Rhizobium esperanzae]
MSDFEALPPVVCAAYMTGAFQSVNTMTTEKTRKISFFAESRHMKESLCGGEPRGYKAA